MSNKKPPFLIGAHMSIAGGLEKALDRAALIDCTAVQLFTHSNRQWQTEPITPQEKKEFDQARDTSNIAQIVAHTSYLINIASPDETVSKRSTALLIKELERCQYLEIPYLVLHPGSFTSGTPEKGLEKITQNLDHVLSTTQSSTKILLETMSGQGTTLGSTFEELAYLIANSKHKKRLGVCFDTCHVFTAGYDLRSSSTYEQTMEKFDKIIGLHAIKVFHINDSKKPLGSRLDRHAHIGNGFLGLEPFKLLCNDERFYTLPKILETPKESLEDDAKNITTIKSLLSEKTRTYLAI